MKRSELEKVDKLVDELENIGTILKAKRGIYIYYNEPTKATREIILHRHTCGQCAYGTGKKIVKSPGKNGVWIGPFSATSQVDQFLKGSGLSFSKKKVCNCFKK
jgi:hypothetical protein